MRTLSRRIGEVQGRVLILAGGNAFWITVSEAVIHKETIVMVVNSERARTVGAEDAKLTTETLLDAINEARKREVPILLTELKTSRT